MAISDETIVGFLRAVFLDPKKVDQQKLAMVARAAADRIEALTAALPHMGGVSVKVLEWDNYSAHTPFGAYTVAEDADDLWHFTFHCYPYGTESEEGWGRKEHAKAAAQADYERRVLSALSPAPTHTQEGLSVTGEVEVATETDDPNAVYTREQVGKITRSMGAALTACQQEVERMRSERDAALEAEDEAKDCFWAIYPDWAKAKGHGISPEAARTVLVKRAETSEARNVELVKALEPFTLFFDKAMEGFTEGYAERQPAEKPILGWNDAQLLMIDFLRARAVLGGQSNEA